MRWLLILLISLLAGSDLLGKDLSLGPGLSAKNAVLYLTALGLFFRAALSGEFRLRLPGMYACFAVWIGYALLTWIACSLVLHYSGYDALRSGIALKSELIDPALFFFTVFYGAQRQTEVTTLWKTLALAVSVANVLTLTDVAGLTDFGVRVGSSGAEADRVFGVFGHANDTGALIVCLLPLLVALAISNRGLARLLWYLAAAVSLAVLILTVSRGAFVALIVGYGWAVWLCRRFLPLPRVAAWLLIGATAAVLVAGVVSLAVPHVAGVVAERLLGQSSAFDMSEVSSGRTNIWRNTVAHMMAEPITLLTGFGWNVYDTRFVYVTHNFYLDQWFNLGLVGVVAFLGLLYQAVTTARAAADVASPQLRRYLIGFVFGMLALAVALFFANLTKPWAYIWMYVGMTSRAAVDALGDVLSHARSAARLGGGPTAVRDAR